VVVRVRVSAFVGDTVVFVGDTVVFVIFVVFNAAANSTTLFWATTVMSNAALSAEKSTTSFALCLDMREGVL